MPTNPAGNEFNDFTGDVIKGAESIKQALENVIKTAGETDSAHNKLAETQRKTKKAADEYANALRKADAEIGNLGSSLGKLETTSKNVGTNLGTAKSEAAGIATSLGQIKGSIGGIQGMGKVVTDVMTDIRNEVKTTSDAMGGLKAECDTKCLDDAMTKVKAIADKINAIGAYKVSIDCDTECLNADLIEDFQKRLGEGVNVKVGVDTSNINKAKLDIDVSNFEKQLLSSQVVLDELGEAVSKISKKQLMLDFSHLEIVKDYASTLSDAERETLSVADAMAKLASGSDALSQRFQNIEKIVDKKLGLERLGNELNDKRKELEKLVKQVEDGRVKVSKPYFLSVNVEAGKLERFQQILEEIKDPAILAKIATMEVSQAMEFLSKNVPGVSDALNEAAMAAEEVAKSSRVLSGEIKKQGNLLDPLIDKYNEGNREAQNFAGGIGVSGGRMIGAGVAAVFLFRKLGELVDRFKDAAVSLAEFNVETALAEKGISGIQYDGQLADLRNDVNLTREQYGAFVEVLRDGANSGVVSINQIVTASKQLQEAFGGDQTKRLEEYVNLLKQIPTLEEDLSITASVDDQTAALFALAKEGKVSTVLELQTAGLLGGFEVEQQSDAALLNANQSTEKTVQDIQDQLLKYFPDWGSQFGAIANGVLAIGGALGGVIVGIGALRAFSGAQIVAQNATTTAVLATKGGQLPKGLTNELKGLAKNFGTTFKKGFSRGGGSLTGVKRGVSGALRSTAFGAGTGPVATASKTLATQLLKIGPYASQAAKGLSTVALPLTALGIAAKFAGGALSEVQDDISEGAGDVSASASRLSGEYLKAVGTVASFAAAGATIGSLVPVIGTAVGAAAGVLVGAGVAVTQSTGKIGNALQDFGGDLQATNKDLNGVEFNKYNDAVRATGEVLQGFGAFISEADESVRDFVKENKISAKSLALTALQYGTSAGRVFTASKALATGLTELAKTTEQRAAEKEAAQAQAETAKSLKKLDKESEGLSKALGERQKIIDDSATALQRALKSIENAANSNALQLVRFRRELGSTRLDVFSEAGSSVGAFDRNIAGLSSSVSKEFGGITKALELERQKILKDAKLQGDARQAALDTLYQEELEAVKRLVEGLDTIVDGLLKAPEIVNAGLRDSIRSSQRELGSKGTTRVEDFQSTFGGGIKASLDGLDAAVNRGSQALQKASEFEEQFANKRKAAEESLIKSIGDAASEISGIEIETVVDAAGEVVRDEAGEPVKKLNVDLNKLGEAATSVDKMVADAKASLDGISKSLSGVAAVKAAESLIATREEILKLSSSLEKAENTLKKAETAAAGADEENITEKEAAVLSAQKRIAQIKEQQEQALEEQTKLTDGIKTEIERATIGLDDIVERDKIRELLFKRLADGVEGSLEQQDLIRKGLSGLTDGTKEQAELVQEWSEALVNLSKGIDQKAIIDSLVNNTTGQNAVLAQVDKAYKKIVEQSDQIIKNIQEQSEIVSKESAEQDRLLRLRQAGVNIAKLNGDAVGAVIDIQNSENRLFEEQLRSSAAELKIIKEGKKDIEERIAARKGEVAAAKKAIEEAKKAGKSTKFLEENLKFIETALKGLERNANEADEVAIKAEEKVNSITGAIADIAGRLDEVIGTFEGSTLGLQIASELDFSEALNEAAKFSDDFVSITGKSYEIVRKAAQADAKERIAAIKRAGEQEKQSILRQQAAKKIEPETAAARLRTVEASTQAHVAREETKEKQRVLDAAKREADIKNEALDIEADIIDAQSEYLSAVGGNLDAFIDLQNQGLAIERAKLKVAEEALENARKDNIQGVELRKLEAAVVKQSIKVQTKEFGKQRDIFENIVGQAFGRIREEVGGKRRNLDIARAGGIAQSRVVLRSGLTAGAGPGGPQTIEQRANALRLSGTANVDAAVGGEPTKNVEEKLFGETQASREANQTTAGAVSNLNERGSKKGSIFTHDDGLHTRMDTLINILRSCCGNLEAIKGSTDESSEADKAQKAATEASQTAVATTNAATGNLPEGVRELQELNDVRLQQAMEEKEGQLTENRKRTAIATGRAVVETKTENAGVVASQPVKAQTSRNLFNTKTVSPEEQEKVIQKGFARAVSTNLMGGKAALGALSLGGDSRFGGQSAKEIRAAAMARREEMKGEAKKAAIQDARKPTPAALAIMKAEEAGSETLGVGLTKDEARAAANQFESNAYDFEAAGRMVEAEAARNAAEQIWESLNGGKTTTGAESLTMSPSTSVTTAEAVKSGQQEIAPPGVQAKAEPNGNAVQDQTTTMNQAEAISNRNSIGSENSTAFQASTSIARIGGESGGSKAAEMPRLKVEGTMRVQFDNGVFRNTIATVVGEVINSPEIVKALTDRGFVNRSQ